MCFTRGCNARARDLSTRDYNARGIRSQREIACLHRTTSPKLLDEAWTSDVAGSHDKALFGLFLIASVGIDSFMQRIREGTIRGSYPSPAHLVWGERGSDVLKEIGIESSINSN